MFCTKEYSKVKAISGTLSSVLFPNAWFYLAEIYSSEGNNDYANRFYENAHENGSLLASRALGEIHDKTRNYKEALFLENSFMWWYISD